MFREIWVGISDWMRRDASGTLACLTDLQDCVIVKGNGSVEYR